MLDQGQKLVPSWDTDLHLRLKQLDSELGESKREKQDCFSTIRHESTQEIEATNSKIIISDNDLNLDVENISDLKLQASLNGHESSSTIEPRSNSIAPVKTLLCQHCNEEFESNSARNAHKRKVHNRRHLCVPCDMAFASSTKLERHLLTHKGTKDHKCHICGKAFMIERNLILHQKLHLGQRDYVCDICGKSYYTKSGLLAHQKQNHSPPNENNCGDEAYIKGSGFVCKDKKCSKRNFATRYDLEEHR